VTPSKPSDQGNDQLTGGQSRPALTIRSRLRRTPGLGLYLAFAAMVPALLLYGWMQMREGFASVDNGILINDWGTVEVADSRWPGVMPGDRVTRVRMDGRPLSVPYPMPKPGQVTIGFRRGDTTWEHTAAAIPWEVRYQAAVGVRLATAALLLLIGLVSFLVKPGQRSSWLFLLFCYSLAVLSLLFFRHDRVSYALQFFTMAAAGGLGLHLFSEFPRRSPRLTRAWPAFYLPALVLPPAAFSVVFDPPAPWSRLAPIADAALWIWCLAAAVGVLAIVVVQWARSRGERLRQYRWILAAVLSGLVLPAVISVGVRVIGVQNPVAMQLAVSTLALFAIFTGYALVRFNVLEVDRFTIALVAHSITLAAATVVFGGVLLALVLVADGTGLASSPPLLVVLTAGTTWAIRPLNDALRRRLDRIFHRDTAAVLDSLPSVVQRIQTSAGEEPAVAAALAAINGLQPDRFDLWRRIDDKWVNVNGEVLSDDSPLGGWLRNGRAAGVGGLAPEVLPGAAEEEAIASALALVVPARTRDRAVAAIGLGRKRSGLGYTEREVAFASAVAQQLAFRLAAPNAAESRIGKYRVEKRLGVGGAAEVFLAYHEGPGGFERRVALKCPLPGYYEDQEQPGDAFFEEARLLAELHHPHIAQVFDAGVVDGAPYIAMEYVDGPPLRTLIRLAPQPSLPVVAAIGDSLLRALAYAHDRTDATGRKRRLVHRDVTPGNVLVSRAGDVKLLDFGIAISDDGRFYRTQAGLVRGTPAYMSPEHAHGLEVDRRTDLYAAAVVLFELATGEKAFPHGPVRSEGLPDAALPKDLDAILRKGMSPKRGDRFDDAEEFRKALLSVLPAASPEGIAAWVVSCQSFAGESNPALNTGSVTVGATARPDGKTTRLG